MPSLVTIITVPDSAISALAPVMPIPAVKNASRISSRAVPTWSRDVLAGYVSSQRGGHVGADLLPGQMHGRHHHVTWSLMAELNDPLAEIGLHYSETGVLGHMVEPNLLAHHRLRFRDQRDIVTPRDLENDAIGSSRIAGSVDGHTGRFSRQAKLVEIRFQIGGDSGLRSLHTRLQRRKIDLVGGAVASRSPALLERGQIVRQLRIIKRAAKTLVELVRMVDWIGRGPVMRPVWWQRLGLVMTLNCTMARAWVHQQDSIDRARLCGTLAPELLAKFARVVVPNDAGDLARVRANNSHLLGEELSAQVGCKFAQRELDRGALAVGHDVGDLPARGRIRADDCPEIGNDLVGGSDQLPMGKGAKRGVIGQRRAQAARIARIDRGEEFPSQLLCCSGAGVHGTVPFHARSIRSCPRGVSCSSRRGTYSRDTDARNGFSMRVKSTCDTAAMPSRAPLRLKTRSMRCSISRSCLARYSASSRIVQFRSRAAIAAAFPGVIGQSPQQGCRALSHASELRHDDQGMCGSVDRNLRPAKVQHVGSGRGRGLSPTQWRS